MIRSDMALTSRRQALARLSACWATVLSGVNLAAPNAEVARAALIDIARSFLKSADWSPRRELGPIQAAYYCNEFVADVARSAGAATWKQIKRPGLLSRYRDPLAGEWGNPLFAITGWTVIFSPKSAWGKFTAQQVLAQRRPGDVVSGGGHVGIVSDDRGGYIGRVFSAASSGSVEHNDWSFRLPDASTFDSASAWEVRAKNEVSKFTVRRFVGPNANFSIAFMIVGLAMYAEPAFSQPSNIIQQMVANAPIDAQSLEKRTVRVARVSPREGNRSSLALHLMGAGYNSITGEVLDKCVDFSQPDETITHNADVDFYHETADNYSSLFRALKVDARASLGFPSFSATANANIATNLQMSSMTHYVAIRAIVENATYKNFGAHYNKKGLAARQSGTFQAQCGDSFISQVTTGGWLEASILAEIKSQFEVSRNRQVLNAVSGSQSVNASRAEALETSMATFGEEIRFRKNGRATTIPDGKSFVSTARGFPQEVRRGTDGEGVLRFGTWNYEIISGPVPGAPSREAVDAATGAATELGEAHLRVARIRDALSDAQKRPDFYQKFDSSVLAAAQRAVDSKLKEIAVRAAHCRYGRLRQCLTVEVELVVSTAIPAPKFFAALHNGTQKDCNPGMLSTNSFIRIVNGRPCGTVPVGYTMTKEAAGQGAIEVFQEGRGNPDEGRLWADNRGPSAGYLSKVPQGLATVPVYHIDKPAFIAIRGIYRDALSVQQNFDGVVDSTCTYHYSDVRLSEGRSVPVAVPACSIIGYAMKYH